MDMMDEQWAVLEPLIPESVAADGGCSLGDPTKYLLKVVHKERDVPFLWQVMGFNVWDMLR